MHLVTWTFYGQVLSCVRKHSLDSGQSNISLLHLYLMVCTAIIFSKRWVSLLFIKVTVFIPYFSQLSSFRFWKIGLKSEQGSMLLLIVCGKELKKRLKFLRSTWVQFTMLWMTDEQ